MEKGRHERKCMDVKLLKWSGENTNEKQSGH